MSSPFKAGRYQDTSAVASERFNVPNRFSDFEAADRSRSVPTSRRRQQNWPLVLLTLILVVAFAGLPVVTAHGTTKGSSKHHTHTTHTAKTAKNTHSSKTANSQSATISSIVQTTLNNIANNGYDPLKGGLWVNWSTGTSPLQADFVNGKPDCLVSGNNVNCKFSPAHDPMTDLRALRNFWTYKTNNPGDHSYDAQIALYTPVVQNEFNNFANLSTNGWLFDEWVGLARLSGDNTYLQIAQSEVNFWYSHYYHPSIGALYFTNHDSTGAYRVDYTLEMATAMAEAGAIFHQSSWLDAGRQAIQFIYLHAYDVNDHLFALDMNNVLTSKGTANQCETFYNPPDALGNDASPSSNLRIALSLLRAYMMTNTGIYLAHALDLMDALSLPQNTAGLWDTQYAGYFTRAQFSGTGYCNFGSLKITSVEKEGGRMLISLEAYHVANWLLGNRYASTESALVSVALNDAYLPAGQGYMFVQAQDWSLLRIEDCGQTNSCVTTEAMGIALEALQATQASNPW